MEHVCLCTCHGDVPCCPCPDGVHKRLEKTIISRETCMREMTNRLLDLQEEWAELYFELRKLRDE